MRANAFVKLVITVVIVSVSSLGLASTFTWNATSSAGWADTSPNSWTPAGPPTSTDTAEFRVTGTGTTDTLDSTRTVAVLRYNPYWPDAALPITITHSTALGGNTLVVSGNTDAGIVDITNSLIPGDNSNTTATISGGTLTPTGIRVANRVSGNSIVYGSYGAGGGSRDWALTGTLNITGTLDSQNLLDVSSGYKMNEDGSTGRGGQVKGVLDLSSATLVYGATPNTFQMRNLNVGIGRDTVGKLRLPASLTNMVVTGDLKMGDYSDTQNTGTNATLTMPSGVTLQVGTAAAPKDMYIGYHSAGDTRSPVYTTLVLSGGSFVPYLNNLRVGYNVCGAGAASGVGTLDLTTTPISGGALNLQTLYVGAGYRSNGYLKIKAATGLTNLNVTGDTFLGSGGGIIGQIGDPTLGPGSTYALPAGVNIKLGTNAGSRGTLRISQQDSGANDYQVTGSMLRTTSGTFEAYLSDLRVGANDMASPGASNCVNGTLDLRNSTFTGAGLNVSGGTVRIGTTLSNFGGVDGGTGPASRGNQTGKVYLPAGNALAGKLLVGNDAAMTLAYMTPDVQGLLDLTHTIFTVESMSGVDVTIKKSGSVWAILAMFRTSSFVAARRRHSGQSIIWGKDP